MQRLLTGFLMMVVVFVAGGGMVSAETAAALNGQAAASLTAIEDNRQTAAVLNRQTATAPNDTSVAPTNTFYVNAKDDTYDGACNLAHCSLREAITFANNNTVAHDDIVFTFFVNTGNGVVLSQIEVQSELPAITSPVSFKRLASNGTFDDPCPTSLTNAGGTYIEIEYFGSSANVDGLTLTGTAVGSDVRGLAIHKFTGHGIRVQGNSNTIQCNRIGTSKTGSVPGQGNGGAGLYVTGSQNTIGGALATERNIIVENGSHGVHLAGGSNNNVYGNYIGMNVTPNNQVSTLGNGGAGVFVEGTSQNIGNGSNNRGNIIGNNTAAGVNLSDTNNADVFGNMIGLAHDGTTAIGNGGNGVFINTGSGNIVGSATGGNVIGSNGGHGIRLMNGTKSNIIQGNTIGMSADGTLVRGNDLFGIDVDNSTLTTIGGTGSAGNLISNNNDGGIRLRNGADDNDLYGNFIGTGLNGTSDFGNEGRGIDITNSDSNSVGATGANGNIISGNNSVGVYVGGSASDNSIVNNRIGVDANDAALANQGDGIAFDGGGSIKTLVEDNIIAHNNGNGINAVGVVSGAQFSANRIYANNKIGIDLNDDGPTKNDEQDLDSGPNGLQNFPEIEEATFDGDVSGFLLGSNGEYTIELYGSPSCDPSGNGEGQFFLGAVVLEIVNGEGEAFDTSVNPFGGGVVTAIATDQNGNSSEFSECAALSGTYSIVVNHNGDAGDADLFDDECETTTNNQCTLRAAIEQANAWGVPGTITFQPNTTMTIMPFSPYPTIERRVTMTGATGTDCPLTTTPPYRIIGGSTSGVSGLTLGPASGGSIIQGLQITDFEIHGIDSQSSSNSFYCNLLTDHGEHGLRIGGSNTRVGDGTAARRNTLVANAMAGVFVASGTSNVQIDGNYIGVVANLTMALGNQQGIVAEGGASNVSIDGNVIADNMDEGVLLEVGVSAEINNNLIGTNAAGTSARPNGSHGISNSGTLNASANILSGNSGSGLLNTTSGVATINGSDIGTTSSGTIALGNQASGISNSGVLTVTNSVLSGNALHGLDNSGGKATVSNSRIGTNNGGTAALANGIDGIYSPAAQPNFISAFAPVAVLEATDNVIAGNADDGIHATGTVRLYGNHIGVGSNGTTRIGNGDIGVIMRPIYLGDSFGEGYEASTLTMGGAASDQSNVVAGNAIWQMQLNSNGTAIPLGASTFEYSAAAIEATITNNFIGVDTTGSADGGTPAGGIYVPASSPVTLVDNHIVGGNTLPAVQVSCNVNPLCDPVGTYSDPNGALNQVVIQNNLIGTDAAGAATVARSASAVLFEQGDGVTLSGNTIGAGSATYDVQLTSIDHGGGDIGGSRNNVISNNFIGVSSDGSADLDSGTVGLSIDANGEANTVSGNVISADSGNIIELLGGSNTLSGNFIGTNASGTANFGSAIGIFISSADNTLFGNTVGFNGVGVLLEGASNNDFYGNGIGTDLSGTRDLGNSGNGVTLSEDSDDNLIGGDITNSFNEIRFNGGHGIQLVDVNNGTTNGNTMRGSHFGSNGGLAINIDNDGVTANDGGDGDSGINDRQNFPVLDSINGSGVVAGTLNTSSGQYRIDVFQSYSCDASGNGEGQEYYGSAFVTVSGSGSFNISPVVAAPYRAYLTAIATSVSTGNTSEFSTCLNNPGGLTYSDLLTIEVNDAGDGTTAVADGSCDANGAAAGEPCTLREAILETNAATEWMTITFNIGGGNATIAPASTLPTITNQVTIDGFSQGGSGGCSPDNPAQPTIGVTLDGSSSSSRGASFDGLFFGTGSDGSVLRGLAIGNFVDNGVLLGSSNGAVYCNHLGISADSSTPIGNSAAGIAISGSNNNVRNNLIGDNDNGVALTGDDNVLLGNVVGSDWGLSADFGNSSHGISVQAGAANNIIGDSTSTLPNTISNNGQDGININGSGAVGNSVFVNSISDNGDLGIDLSATGVLPNDTGDGDGGPNHRQNYPVLTGHNSCDILGTLNTTPNTQLRIDVYHSTSFDVSGHGEGMTWFGTTTATTDGSGNVSFAVPSHNDLTGFPFFTAVATNLSTGSSSEFSGYYAYDGNVPTVVTMRSGASGGAGTWQAPLMIAVALVLSGVAIVAVRRRSALLVLVAVGGMFMLADGGAVGVVSAETNAACQVVSGILNNDSVFTDSSGLVIGTGAGTLTESVPLFVSDQPTAPVTYDDPPTPVSNYFTLGTQTDAVATSGLPFVIGLPIPPTADPTQLAVGMLLTSTSYDDIEWSGQNWVHIDGYHDADDNLFTITLDSLGADGVTLVLLEHPSHEPITFPTSRDVFSQHFRLSCANWIFRAACTTANYSAVGSFLDTIYFEYQQAGFLEPLMNKSVGTFDAGHTVYEIHPQYLTAYIQTDGTADLDGSGCVGGVGGWYSSGTKNLTVCIDPSAGLDDRGRNITRHELFHAIQSSYSLTKDKWIGEGTAAAAGEGILPLKRSAIWSPHHVDIDLRSSASLHEYQAQDFWAYVGQELYPAQGLAYLKPIFQIGLQTANVETYAGFDLGNMYWKWAKNQVYEKQNSLNGALTSPCSIQTALVNEEAWVLSAAGTFSGNDLIGPMETVVDRYDVTVEMNDVTVSAVKTSGPGEFQYKVYKAGEVGCGHADGSRTFDQLVMGDEIYVIATNSSHTSSALSNFVYHDITFEEVSEE